MQKKQTAKLGRKAEPQNQAAKQAVIILCSHYCLNPSAEPLFSISPFQTFDIQYALSYIFY